MFIKKFFFISLIFLSAISTINSKEKIFIQKKDISNNLINFLNDKNEKKIFAKLSIKLNTNYTYVNEKVEKLQFTLLNQTNFKLISFKEIKRPNSTAINCVKNTKLK